jgi:hypothetical protein
MATFGWLSIVNLVDGKRKADEGSYTCIAHRTGIHLVAPKQTRPQHWIGIIHRDFDGKFPTADNLG